MEQEEGSRQSSMSVRLKLRLASQQALADLPLPKQMLHARQNGCGSNSDRENWALSWGTADFLQSVRTEGSAILPKAISHLGKGAVPRKKDGRVLPSSRDTLPGRLRGCEGSPCGCPCTGMLRSPAPVVRPGCVTSKAFRSSSFSCSAGCAAK